MSRLVLVLGGFIWVFGWGFGDVIVMCSGVVGNAWHSGTIMIISTRAIQKHAVMFVFF